MEDGDIQDFLLQSVQFVIGRGYLAILEGILPAKKYREMLQSLANEFSCVAFYMDVSLEETLRRHMTKPNCHEFGRQEMQEWYVSKDYLGEPKEITIPEEFSLNRTVELVLERSLSS